ncbi:MAG: hypothetical protein JRJ70_04670 [Deltaproteobacteria bacterium]|nr:hypothetical protein [Deltaproteobacteria bacterium]
MLGDLTTIAPNPGHYALAALEKVGVIKTVITQNIDNLHQRAGSKNVLDYHGNAFKLRCRDCTMRFDEKEYDLQGLWKEGKLPPLCRHSGRKQAVGLIAAGGHGDMSSTRADAIPGNMASSAPRR